MFFYPYLLVALVLGLCLPAGAAPAGASQHDSWGQLDKLIKPGQDPAARKAAIIKAVRASAVVAATVTIDASIDENNIARIDIGSGSADLDCRLRSLKVAKNVFQSDIAVRQVNVNWQTEGSGKSIHLQRTDVARIDKGEDPMRVAASLEAHPMPGGKREPAPAKPSDAPGQQQANAQLQGTPASSQRLTPSALTAKDVDFKPYLMDLQRRLKRAWFPPKGHESRRAAVVFRIDVGGEMSRLRLHRSSGEEIADQAVLKAVDNASPFRPLPAGVSEGVEFVAFMHDGLVEAEIASADVVNSTAGRNSPEDRVDKSEESADASKSGSAASSSALSLNNEGVRALSAGDFQLAIDKLEQALKVNSAYKTARENLAIAYNNLGLRQQKEPRKAIKQFHKAIYIDPHNVTTQQNLDGIIRSMDMNPKSFTDRVALADEALKEGDQIGALVEYQQALAIKEDSDVRAKLEKLPTTQDPIDLATTTSTRDVDFTAYLQDLQRRIKRAWFPPGPNEYGRVYLGFKIHQDGKIAGLHIEHSSGDEKTDRAAFKAADNAAPFRPLPAGSPDVVEVVASMRNGEVETETLVPEDPAAWRTPLKDLIEKTVKGTDMTGYFDNVTRQLKQSWHPDSAPADPVAIEFTILKNGKIQNVNINEPSGNSPFDNGAKEAVQRITQLDRLPQTVDEKLYAWAVFDGATKDVLVGTPKELDFGPYMKNLQRKIRLAWFPPKGHESREVVVIFKLDKQGQMSNFRINKSSGVPAADRAATEAVKDASPMPKLPRGAPSTVDIQFKFDYKEHKGRR